jgi:hypothetical protein
LDSEGSNHGKKETIKYNILDVRPDQQTRQQVTESVFRTSALGRAQAVAVSFAALAAKCRNTTSEMTKNAAQATAPPLRGKVSDS